MQWWCSVQGSAWTWQWQPYVGVWIFVAALAAGYYFLVHHTLRQAFDRARVMYLASGLLLLWAALDWPLGPLGASYLASVHMLQYLFIGVAAPPLLLLSLPSETYTRIRANHRLVEFLESVTHPVVAFFVFNVVMTVTHWPSVVDGMMQTQAGSFALDMSWLVAGIIFWWPLVAPVPTGRVSRPCSRWRTSR